MVIAPLTNASCYYKPGGFWVFEINKVEVMLDEVDLSSSEGFDPSTRMQNLNFPPNKLVGGKWDSDGKNMTITLWLKDTTGKILFSKSKSGQVKDFDKIINNASKELADTMCKNKDVPTNPWVGFITYENTEKSESKNRDPYVLGDRIDRAGNTHSSLRVNIKIGLTGVPQAFIVSKLIVTNEEIGTGKINCGKRKGWRSTGFHKKSLLESKGFTTANASVSVKIGKGNYDISFYIPEIKRTVTFSESMNDEGGCAEPYDKKSPPFTSTETVPVPISDIFQEPLPKNQNELSGSKKFSNAGTITWKLTKTNSASGINNRH
jgi:hypothetical protein